MAVILKDQIGNTVREGDKLFWPQTGLLLTVASIDGAEIILPNGRKIPPTVTFTIKMLADINKPLTQLPMVKTMEPNVDTDLPTVQTGTMQGQPIVTG